MTVELIEIKKFNVKIDAAVRVKIQKALAKGIFLAARWQQHPYSREGVFLQRVHEGGERPFGFARPYRREEHLCRHSVLAQGHSSMKRRIAVTTSCGMRSVLDR